MGVGILSSATFGADNGASLQGVLKNIAIGAAAVSALYAVTSVVRMYRIRARLRRVEDDVQLPDDFPLPIIGNTPNLMKSFFGTLHGHVHEKVFVVWVGANPFVIVNNLASVRRVLTGSGGRYVKPKYFGYRSRTIRNAVEAEQKAVELDSAELAAGDYSRAALVKLIESEFHWMEDRIGRIAYDLAHSPGNTSSFRGIQENLVHLNLQLLYKFDDIESAKKLSRWIAEAGLEFAQRMANPFRAWYCWVANARYLSQVVGLIRTGRQLCKHLDDIAADHQHESAPSWMHAWLGKVGKIGKLGKVVGLLMASTQTVPLTAIWCLYLVATHPEAYQKIASEARAKLDRFDENKGAVVSSLDQLESLEYLDAVVRETLRLYPPFPVLQRQAEHDDNLDGATVTEKQILYIVPWLIHHNPSIWKDPEEFRPQRFLENAAHGDAENDYAFIPFGRGSRMCAGYRLALVEVKLLVLCLVRSSTWTAQFDPPDFPPINMVPRDLKLSFKLAKT